MYVLVHESLSRLSLGIALHHPVTRVGVTAVAKAARIRRGGVVMVMHIEILHVIAEVAWRRRCGSGDGGSARYSTTPVAAAVARARAGRAAAACRIGERDRRG